MVEEEGRPFFIVPMPVISHESTGFEGFCHEKRSLMTVSIAKVHARYATHPPFHPSKKYPEYSGELSSEENPAYDGVREALELLGV